jgi:hypothetical protein
MRALSISRAWDETKAIVARDGRLFVSVALALVALPTTVTGLLSPKGMGDPAAPLWVDIVVLVASLIALAGQLALIRLALGPSITVGQAIVHGIRRMPIYLLAAILIVVALMIVAIPFGVVLTTLGVELNVKPVPATPPVVIAAILYFALVCFVGVRMLMSAPVASAERAGSIAVIKRSWVLTDGNWWRLFGFLLMFFIGAMVVLIGVGAELGVVVGILLGPIQPMSASSLVVALIKALLNAGLTTLLAVMLARIYSQLAARGEAEASVPTTGI